MRIAAVAVAVVFGGAVEYYWAWLVTTRRFSTERGSWERLWSMPAHLVAAFPLVVALGDTMPEGWGKLALLPVAVAWVWSFSAGISKGRRQRG